MHFYGPIFKYWEEHTICFLKVEFHINLDVIKFFSVQTVRTKEEKEVLEHFAGVVSTSCS